MTENTKNSEFLQELLYVDGCDEPVRGRIFHVPAPSARHLCSEPGKFIECLKDEKWAEIPRFEGIYWASSQGRLRSRKKLLVPHESKGYLVVGLSRGGHSHTYGVHRLVCMAFRGLPPAWGMHTRHLDGTRTNNCIENLVWGTPKENAQDTVRHGRSPPKGEKNLASVLNDEKVRAIRAAGFTNVRQCAEMAREFGVSPFTIFYVAKGKTWTHVK